MKKNKKKVIIITLVVLMMGMTGAFMFIFADTDGYDPDKEYRCPGVCKIQQLFGIDND